MRERERQEVRRNCRESAIERKREGGWERERKTQRKGMEMRWEDEIWLVGMNKGLFPLVVRK
jgi:hypothetical protein